MIFKNSTFLTLMVGCLFFFLNNEESEAKCSYPFHEIWLKEFTKWLHKFHFRDFKSKLGDNFICWRDFSIEFQIIFKHLNSLNQRSRNLINDHWAWLALVIQLKKQLLVKEDAVPCNARCCRRITKKSITFPLFPLKKDQEKLFNTCFNQSRN